MLRTAFAGARSANCARSCCRPLLSRDITVPIGMPTIAGINTRRYHGLLVAATTPPVGRLVLLSKLEETLLVDGQRFELSANRYPGVTDAGLGAKALGFCTRVQYNGFGPFGLGNAKARLAHETDFDQGHRQNGARVALYRFPRPAA